MIDWSREERIYLEKKRWRELVHAKVKSFHAKTSQHFDMRPVQFGKTRNPNYSAGLTRLTSLKTNLMSRGQIRLNLQQEPYLPEYLVPSWKMLCRMDITVKLGNEPWHRRISQRRVGSLFLGRCGITTSLHTCAVRKEERKEKHNSEEEIWFVQRTNFFFVVNAILTKPLVVSSLSLLVGE